MKPLLQSGFETLRSLVGNGQCRNGWEHGHKRRILFCCGDFLPRPGGAQSVVDDLACAFHAAGHEVTVLTRRHPGTRSLDRLHGYDIIRIDYPVAYEKFEETDAFRSRSGAILSHIEKILRDRRIDTVLVGLLDMSALYLYALRQRAPFQLGLYLHGGETRKLPDAEPTYRELLVLSLHTADVIIAVSPQLAQEAIARVSAARSKIQVIRNGINVRDLASVSPRKHGRDYICFVGRLVPEKNLGRLIKAFRAISPEIAEVDLLIAGSGREEKQLRKLAQTSDSKANQIQFLGSMSRKDAWALIKGALFTVLPSITEGHPVVALEALAMGRPLLASRIPGILAATGEGRHAALFPPKDLKALTTLLRRYFTDRAALAALTSAAREADLGSLDVAHLYRDHLRALDAIELNQPAMILR